MTTIPGAHRLAHVAAKDPIADLWPQFTGHGALQFDGQVGNAAARIEQKGSRKSLRWAIHQAAHAAAAAAAVAAGKLPGRRAWGRLGRKPPVQGKIAVQDDRRGRRQRRRQRGWIVWIERFGHQEGCQQQPGAKPGMNQAGVFANEAQPSLLRPVTFEHRRRVHADLAQRGAAALRAQPAVQREQARLEQIVVIHTPGIAGDASARRVEGQLGRQRPGRMADAQHDQGTRGRQALM